MFVVLAVSDSVIVALIGGLVTVATTAIGVWDRRRTAQQSVAPAATAAAPATRRRRAKDRDTRTLVIAGAGIAVGVVLSVLVFAFGGIGGSDGDKSEASGAVSTATAVPPGATPSAAVATTVVAASPTPPSGSSTSGSSCPAPATAEPGAVVYQRASQADDAGNNDMAIRLYIQALCAPDLPSFSREHAMLEIGTLEVVMMESGANAERCSTGRTYIEMLLALPGLGADRRGAGQATLNDLRRICRF